MPTITRLTAEPVPVRLRGQIGTFTLGPYLAEGSFGIIHEAHAIWDSPKDHLPNNVVVKLPIDAEADSAMGYENAILTRIGDGRQHIIPLYDFGHTDDNHRFLVLPRCGLSLSDYLGRNGPERLSQAHIYHLIAQAAAGVERLQYLTQGVHGDIKPDNFLFAPIPREPALRHLADDPGGFRLEETSSHTIQFVDDNGGAWQLVLADFGTASRFGRETRGYSIPYRPPEAANNPGHVVMPTNDVYALAVMSYKLAVAGIPTPPEPAPGRLRHLRTDLDATLLALVDRALQPNAQDRPSTVTDFLHDLHQEGPPPPPTQTRNAWLVTLTADKRWSFKWPVSWKGTAGVREGDLILAYCTPSRDADVRVCNPYQHYRRLLLWIGFAASDAYRDISEDTGRPGYYFTIGWGAELPRPLFLPTQDQPAPRTQPAIDRLDPVIVNEQSCPVWGDWRAVRTASESGCVPLSHRAALVAWLLQTLDHENPGHPILARLRTLAPDWFPSLPTADLTPQVFDTDTQSPSPALPTNQQGFYVSLIGTGRSWLLDDDEPLAIIQDAPDGVGPNRIDLIPAARASQVHGYLSVVGVTGTPQFCEYQHMSYFLPATILRDIFEAPGTAASLSFPPNTLPPDFPKVPLGSMDALALGGETFLIVAGRFADLERARGDISRHPFDNRALDPTDLEWILAERRGPREVHLALGILGTRVAVDMRRVARATFPIVRVVALDTAVLRARFIATSGVDLPETFIGQWIQLFLCQDIAPWLCARVCPRD